MTQLQKPTTHLTLVIFRQKWSASSVGEEVLRSVRCSEFKGGLLKHIATLEANPAIRTAHNKADHTKEFWLTVNHGPGRQSTVLVSKLVQVEN